MWPNWAIYRHLGDFLKYIATNVLVKIAQNKIFEAENSVFIIKSAFAIREIIGLF